MLAQNSLRSVRGLLQHFVRTVDVARLRVAAVATLALLAAGCKTELHTNLPAREANEIVSVLLANGIDAERQQVDGEGYSVSVTRGEKRRSIAILSNYGLPREEYFSLGDVFDTSKMVSTPFEERARFMHALNQELSQSITQIAGVVSARVHVMLPETSPLDRDMQDARASIFIYHAPGVGVQQHVPVIKNLVVNSVNGLQYEDVTVATFPANTATSTPLSGGNGQLSGLLPVVLLLLALPIGLLLLRRRGGRGRGTA